MQSESRERVHSVKKKAQQAMTIRAENKDDRMRRGVQSSFWHCHEQVLTEQQRRMLLPLSPSRPPLWIFAHGARRRVRDAEYLMTAAAAARNAQRMDGRTDGRVLPQKAPSDSAQSQVNDPSL